MEKSRDERGLSERGGERCFIIPFEKKLDMPESFGIIPKRNMIITLLQ
jgi:hypothetical protein